MKEQLDKAGMWSVAINMPKVGKDTSLGRGKDIPGSENIAKDSAEMEK